MNRISQTGRRHLPFVIYFIAVVLVVGCTKPIVDPQAPLSLPPTDSKTKQAFEKGTEAFAAKQDEAAETAFSDVIERSGATNAALRGAATVYLARLALRQNQPQRAYDLLNQLGTESEQEAVRTQRRYYLGIACARTERYECAQRLLEPQLAALAPAARIAALAALALTCSRTGHTTKALVYLDAIYRNTDRPVERRYAHDQITAVVGAMSQTDLETARSTMTDDGIARGIVATRLQDTQTVRGTNTPTKIARVGVLLPKSGRYRSIGQLARKAIVIASGTLDATSGLPAVELFFADSVTDPQSAALQLIQEDGVDALLGTFQKGTALAVSDVAREQSTPFVCLSPQVNVTDNSFMFSLVPSNAPRAHRLAAFVHQLGKGKRVAIINPKSVFGRSMATEFRNAIESSGGVVVTTIEYPPTTKVFDNVEPLQHVSFDTVFVPDRAQTVGRIASALANIGTWSTAQGRPAPEGRAITLVATADGLATTDLRSNRRYLDGAVFAPGYFPTNSDPAAQQLIAYYQQTSGNTPTLVEALAHDSVYLLRQTFASLQANAHNKPIVQTLIQTNAVGITGSIKLTADGRSTAAPLLYQMRNGEILPL